MVCFHANIMHTGNQQQRIVWKEFIISGIIDRNTVYDANTGELDNGLVNEFFYLTELNPTHRESRIIQKYAYDEQALAE